MPGLALFRRRVALSPPAVLAMLYAALVGLGALLLKAPFATPEPIGWSQALFTSASAVTVTGLAVVDTGTGFTLFGQAVILVLIQLGGLGLMTFAALVLSMLGRPMGLSSRAFLREDLNQTSISELFRLVRLILRVVAACELAGAAVLAVVFVPADGLWPGLWSAVFHSVSAFNNAGFSLYPDSLSAWVGNPIVNLAVPALFIVGGLGYMVLHELLERRPWRKMSLHSKLTLAGTAGLLAWGMAVFAILEWTNPGTLGELPLHAKLLASWFQSATTRTAGFNSVDIGQMHDSTSLMFMSLMMIGGGSTSTAGGIKVTTFIVLILATVAFFRRRQTLHAFGRSLGVEEVMKVLALAMVSLLTVMAATFVLAISHDGDFVNLAFEAVSAFGTVGLSRGATGELDGFERLVIVFLMFLGRVGPLTLGFFLATRVPPRVRYPSGRVFLG
tara:strand:+ start:749 stop:2083 length:1335 start_codon:yes stop_codon:yes gene_type:complete